MSEDVENLAKTVYLLYWDRDPHEDGCACGRCNTVNWISYGVAFFDIEGEPYVDPVGIVYAPSIETAYEQARKEADNKGWTIVDLDDLDNATIDSLSE